MEYENATVKFNGGIGALLCSGCQRILELGFQHKDVEHYCASCTNKLEFKNENETTYTAQEIWASVEYGNGNLKNCIFVVKE